MTVTVAHVATELARPTPSSPVSDQWQSWIERAYRLVSNRFDTVAYDLLDPDDVDDVVLMAVAEHVRAWRDSTASRRTISVDDGSITTQHEAAVGLLEIPDSLWVRLDPTAGSTGAFSVTPHFEPDRPAVWP